MEMRSGCSGPVAMIVAESKCEAPERRHPFDGRQLRWPHAFCSSAVGFHHTLPHHPGPHPHLIPRYIQCLCMSPCGMKRQQAYPILRAIVVVLRQSPSARRVSSWHLEGSITKFAYGRHLTVSYYTPLSPTAQFYRLPGSRTVLSSAACKTEAFSRFLSPK